MDASKYGSTPSLPAAIRAKGRLVWRPQPRESMLGTLGILLLVVVVVGAFIVAEVAISLLVWWALTGPGGMTINPWLFGVLAFVCWMLMGHLVANARERRA